MPSRAGSLPQGMGVAHGIGAPPPSMVGASLLAKALGQSAGRLEWPLRRNAARSRLAHTGDGCGSWHWCPTTVHGGSEPDREGGGSVSWEVGCDGLFVGTPPGA